jgi:hypothetical protein
MRPTRRSVWRRHARFTLTDNLRSNQVLSAVNSGN